MATEPQGWEVNIGSGYNLVLSDYKLLPDPLFIYLFIYFFKYIYTGYNQSV